MKKITNKVPPSDFHDFMNYLDDYAMPVPEYLDRQYGTGSWKFDPYANQYVVCRGRTPAARNYLIVGPDSSEYALSFPEDALH
jgi:hypothetical protein